MIVFVSFHTVSRVSSKPFQNVFVKSFIELLEFAVNTFVIPLTELVGKSNVFSIFLKVCTETVCAEGVLYGFEEKLS